MPDIRAAVLFLVLTSLLGLTSGYQVYQTKIPNGDNVPHPCKPNYTWKGVGHINPLGGGNRNPFGLDFASKGRNWNQALCQADSDGDGKTNGQELGDPTCQWTEGQIPPVTSGITHPGVCEPWDSSTCQEKNTWVTCDTGEFNCSATMAPDVFNFTLRFNHTKVPEQVTNYYCQTFHLPDDKDYHIVATQPLLNNTQVMHHMLLFGCDQKRNESKSAQSCSMGGENCTSIIGGWTVGLPGECLPDNIGFLVGKSGFKSVVLQFHWNNPEKRTDYYDSSAMILYLTASMREQEAGVLTVGQNYLEIPPGVSQHKEVASMTSSCSNMVVQKDFNIVIGLNHMHYLGRSMRMELFRDEQKVTDLAYDEAYSYDNPVTHIFETPVVVKRGDEIRTTCVYSSSSRATTTYYGDGTNDEMCFGFLTYYPKDALLMQTVVDWKSLDFCQWALKMPVGECNVGRFLNTTVGEILTYFSEVMDKCNAWGSCKCECRAAVRRFRQHPCFQGDVGDFVLLRITERIPDVQEFINRAQTCPEEFNDRNFSATAQPTVTCPTVEASRGSASIPMGGVLGPLLVLLVVVAVPV